MDDFVNRMNMDTENMMNSRNNFQQLENKFKIAISKCSKQNLVGVDVEVNKYEVKNATSVEHYLVDGGLHIYKFYNGKQTINYWISSRPIREEYEFIGLDSKKHIGDRYTDVSCFEYSCGGIGNSLPLDGIDKYSVSCFIGALVPSSYGSRPRSDLIATSGYELSRTVASILGFYSYTNENNKLYKSGDLFGYIKNIKASAEEISIVDDLQKVINAIETLSLASEKDVQNKKSFLKTLLGINKELDTKIDVFGMKKGR